MDAYIPECLVTGCSLFNRDEGTVAHGDLFEMGEVYIFNATAQEPAERGLWEGERALIYGDATPYFERRNLYVIAKHAPGVRLNTAATKHILGAK